MKKATIALVLLTSLFLQRAEAKKHSPRRANRVVEAKMHAPAKRKQVRRKPARPPHHKACWCIDEPTLCGSHDSQAFQNFIANRDNLERFEDADALGRSIGRGELVALKETEYIHLSNEHLPAEYRWVRPWVKRFIDEMARMYFSEFGEALQINSAVRTRVYQRAIMHHNTNAAALDGPEASSHMTGATIDIAKKPMSSGELGWVRHYLKDMEKRGALEATEECSQLVFHVMVFQEKN